MLVRVTRTDGTSGEASAVVTTSAGSAEAGTDYTETSTRVTFADGDSSPRLVEIPILPDDESEPDETFSVSLTDAQCGVAGEQSQTEATIVDDDSPDKEPASFTIGGTVERAAGLRAGTRQPRRPPRRRQRPFAFPGAVADGLPYDVTVATQPSDPDQVCTVSERCWHSDRRRCDRHRRGLRPARATLGSRSERSVATAGCRPWSATARPKPSSSSPTAASSLPAVAP